MAATEWWVGAYIEAGMGTSSSGTPYLPFVFSAANETDAKANAGAKLLAGPFSTQAAAQTWANNYEKNPSTLHAGNDLGTSGSTVEQGDSPPSVSGFLASISGISGTNLVNRALKIVVGGALVIIGVAHMTGASGSLATAARKALPV